MDARGSRTRGVRTVGFLVIAFCALALAVGAEDAPLAVIVHPSRAESIDVAELRRIYLRIRRQWDDGTPIIAVNREAESAVRAAFTERVLRMSPARLAAYWNERYFDGVLPPITLSSDVAVKRYVAADPGAIGYVDPSLVDDTVRRIPVLP